MQERDSRGLETSATTDESNSKSRDDDLIDACPECEYSGIHRRTTPRFDASERYRCRNCTHTFANPIRRPPKQVGGKGGDVRRFLLEADPEDLIADGGTSWADLTGFQRDTLEVIQRLEDDVDEPVYGLAIKRALAKDYGEVNHGRLYPNLDDLVDRGLVEKSQLDRRTNEYVLSDAGKHLLQARTRQLMSTTGVRTPTADGGHDV